MKVVLTSYYSIGKISHMPGEIIELKEAEAKRLIKQRGAKPVPKPTEKAVKDDPKKETR